MREPSAALAPWGHAGPLHPADNGNINQTWIVGAPPDAVLQWVNPIFSPKIHVDIDAITAHLLVRGMPTPRLLRTLNDQLWIDEFDGGCWRLMTFIPGQTLHRTRDPAIAANAGALLGRFHDALADCDHTFVAPSRNIHDTPARMAELEEALRAHPDHPLFSEAAALGAAILSAWAAWQARWGDPNNLPTRICHGDPKISNLRFSDNGDALCLLDLDTVGPGTLSAELGDAWRSWCNPGGEDDPRSSRFDVDIFAASARGYLTTAPGMQPDERESLAPGLERICLELAARFCADALKNNYFREDRARWPEVGRHNLLRAEGQQRLAASAHRELSQCQRIVEQASASVGG